jgi:hypothetical protein
MEEVPADSGTVGSPEVDEGMVEADEPQRIRVVCIALFDISGRDIAVGKWSHANIGLRSFPAQMMKRLHLSLRTRITH